MFLFRKGVGVLLEMRGVAIQNIVYYSHFNSGFNGNCGFNGRSELFRGELTKIKRL